MSISDTEETVLEYIADPFASVSRTWASICVFPGAEDSSDSDDVLFACFAMLAGSTLGHLMQNIQASRWHAFAERWGSPAHSRATDTVAQLIWWLHVSLAGATVIADTYHRIPDAVLKRRLKESCATWEDEPAQAAHILEVCLLETFADEFQIQPLADNGESRRAWADALENLLAAAEYTSRHEDTAAVLRRLYASPRGVLS